MKKYILLALLSVICLVSFSQPVTQRGTTAVTVQDARLYAQFNFKPPVYDDTTAANLQKGIDSCGSLIFVKATSQYFYRACEPKKWVPIVGGSNNTVINFESRIVSGSAVWRTGMIYDVTFCNYIIGGVPYTSSPAFVTLATADSSNPRVDVIYLDTLGNVGVLTGNPSPDPVKPVVNPLSQIELTHIDISAQGSTPAGVSSDIIYDENLQQPTEWNTSITAGTLNPNYTTNPYVGSKSFLFGETGVGQSAGFSYGSNSVELDSVRLLSFYLRQNSVPQTSISIDGTVNPLMIIRLYNDGAAVSGDIGIRRGFYGYERDTINKYQLIAIDLSTVRFDNNVQFIDSISVTMFSNIKLGFQIDYMRWQFGGGTPPPTLTNFWSLDGNDIADKPGAVLGTTSRNPLSIVVNGNEVMNLDLENQVNLVGNVPLVTDTTAYKPLVINTSGTVAQVGNWGTAGVSQVTGVAPVFSSGGTTPAISMSIASSTTDGYLTQTDWATFNNKISPADTLNLSARINNNYDSIVKISDTSFYLRKANGTTKDTVLFGNAIVYTENPIMARVSNDSNIIYFNPDTAAVWRGGGSGSQNLQQVTDVGNTTTNDIFVEFSPSWVVSGLFTDGTAGGSSIGVWSSADTLGVQDVRTRIQASGSDTTRNKTLLTPLKSGTIALVEDVIDSLKRNPGTDSVFARKNGQWNFQYKDSVGGSGSTPKLSQVLAAGDTADNRILLSNGTQKQLLETSFGNSTIYTIGGPSSQNSMSSNTTVSSIASVVGGNFISQTAQAGQATIDMASDSSSASIVVGDKIFRLGGFDTVALARIKPSLPYDMYYMPFTTSANNKDTLATLRDVRNNSSTIDTTSLSNRINTKLNISDTTVFQRKNIASYSFKANNTNAAANATDVSFRQSGMQTYTGTIVFGGTAPSGATNHTYNFTQVGNLVTLNVTLIYATAGTGVTTVTLPLPTDCPAPKEQTGLGATNDVLYYGIFQSTSGLTYSNTSRNCVIRKKSATVGDVELTSTIAAANNRFFSFTISYFTN